MLVVFARTIFGVPNAIVGAAACAQNARDGQNDCHNHSETSGRPQEVVMMRKAADSEAVKRNSRLEERLSVNKHGNNRELEVVRGA